MSIEKIKLSPDLYLPAREAVTQKIAFLARSGAGAAKAESPALTPTLASLHESVLAVLTAPQAKILRVVLRAYPDAVSRVDVANEIGVSPTSGAYANNISRLSTLQAIEYPSKGSLIASALLFPAGLP